MQLDEALQHLGSKGKHHVIIFTVIALLTVRDPWQVFGISFIGFDTPHRCRVLDNGTYNVSIPTVCSDECSCKPDKCLMYRNETTNETVPCQYGWQYETQFVSKFHYALDYEATVVMEWDLVCDKGGMVDLSITIYMAGVLLGTTLSQLSDKFGRKKVLLLALWLQGALGIGTAFVTDFIQFAVLRFFSGTLNHVSILVGYVYLVELYPASSRTNPGIFVQIFWGLGVALLAPIAFLFKNWRILQLAISAPAVLFLPLYWILPESVFWLANKGRFREAEKVLCRAAKMNGKSLPERCLTEVELSPADEHGMLLKANKPDGGSDPKLQEHRKLKRLAADSASGVIAAGSAGQTKHTILDLFRTPAMRLYTLILCFIWFTVCGNYMALSLNASELYGNKYVNFAIGGLIEIPAYLVTAPLMQKFGRRMPLMSFMVLGGLATIITVLVPVAPHGECEATSLKWVMTAIAMVGKFGITGSYGVIYLMTPEMFPTSVRNVGVGICSFCETIGGLGAPLLGYAANVLPWLPAAVLGTLAILAGIGALFLADTHNRPLPNEVKDVEAWAKEGHLFSKICH